jgi:hypothetical protein
MILPVDAPDEAAAGATHPANRSNASADTKISSGSSWAPNAVASQSTFLRQPEILSRASCATLVADQTARRTHAILSSNLLPFPFIATPRDRRSRVRLHGTLPGGESFTVSVQNA